MSMPPPKSDDPRLTAYALGDADTSERQAVEKILSESAEARAEVERIRALARALVAGYAQEHERYLATRSTVELPANVVAFPVPRGRRWHRAAGPLLKAAAVLVFGASVAYLALRSPRQPGSVTAASVPTSPPAPAVATPSGIPEVPGAEADSRAKNAPDSEQVAVVPPPPAAMGGAAAAETPPASVDGLLASEDRPTGAVGQVARTRAAAPSAPAPASRRNDASRLPDAAVAASGSPGSSAPDESFARPVVCVRSPAGSFFAGVIVSSDGLILSRLSLTENVAQARCTVRMSDGRELAASAQRSALGTGWYWLRIHSSSLPVAALATATATAGASLAGVHVDPASGALTFPRVHPTKSGVRSYRDRSGDKESSITAGDDSFAFNAAGELFLVEPRVTTEKSAGAARAARGYPAAAAATVRSFTPAEREIIRRAVAGEASE